MYDGLIKPELPKSETKQVKESSQESRKENSDISNPSPSTNNPISPQIIQQILMAIINFKQVLSEIKIEIAQLVANQKAI